MSTTTERTDVGSESTVSVESGRGGRGTVSVAPESRTRTVGLAVVALLSFGVVGYALVVYGGFDPESTVVDLRNTTWHHTLLMWHILTGAVALGLGPLQFIRRIRARHPRVHRWIGRSYLFLGVFPSALVGIPVALLSVEGPWASAGLLVGDIAWFTTGIVAFRAARQRRYRDHGRWMTWNFALTFSAVTFRIWLPIMIFGQTPLLQSTYRGDFDALFTVAYSTTTWLAFLPNVAVLIVAQRIVRRRRRAVAQSRRDGAGRVQFERGL